MLIFDWWHQRDLSLVGVDEGHKLSFWQSPRLEWWLGRGTGQTHQKSIWIWLDGPGHRRAAQGDGHGARLWLELACLWLLAWPGMERKPSLRCLLASIFSQQWEKQLIWHLSFTPWCEVHTGPVSACVLSHWLTSCASYSKQIPHQKLVYVLTLPRIATHLLVYLFRSLAVFKQSLSLNLELATWAWLAVNKPQRSSCLCCSWHWDHRLVHIQLFARMLEIELTFLHFCIKDSHPCNHRLSPSISVWNVFELKA